jgi:hypothetical protein
MSLSISAAKKPLTQEREKERCYSKLFIILPHKHNS